MAVYRDLEGVAIILADNQNRIAMQLRENKPDLPAANQWGLFGGLLEQGENPQNAILREIREELSVQLNPTKVSLLGKHYIPEQNLTTWIFHYPITGELDYAILHEGQAWDFIGKDDERINDIGLHHHEIVLDYWKAFIG